MLQYTTSQSNTLSSSKRVQTRRSTTTIMTRLNSTSKAARRGR